MKARKTKQFPLFGGNVLDECPECLSVIVNIGFNRGICPSCARLEILSLRKQVKRLTKRAPDAGDSTASRSRVHASAETTSQEEIKPAQRG